MSLSQAVKDRISELMEITFDEKSRRTDHVYARLIFIKYYTELGFSTTRIGEMLNKNHSTIIHCKKVFIREYETSKYFRAIYDEVARVPIFDYSGTNTNEQNYF